MPILCEFVDTHCGETAEDKGAIVVETELFGNWRSWSIRNVLCSPNGADVHHTA